MKERLEGKAKEKLAIFCPIDLMPEATWLADNKLNPTAITKTLMAGSNGERIEGVNIHVQGDPQQIKDLFLNHLGWQPQVFVDDGDYYDA